MRGYGELPSETIKALGGSPSPWAPAKYTWPSSAAPSTARPPAHRHVRPQNVRSHQIPHRHQPRLPEFLVAVNLKFWNSLSADQKKIIQQAADEVRDNIRAQTKAEDEKPSKASKTKAWKST
jgi:hypothetical protein